MDENEIKETDVWVLYNKNSMYARKMGFFDDVDRNNNFYNGNQWNGLLVEGIEPVQYNFIKPIVNYKTGIITSNLRAINYNADNTEGTKFRLAAKKVCELLTQRAARVWECNKMDNKIRKIVKQAAIDSEAIIYVYYDEDTNNPVCEILNKVDVFYGNENESDIQNQPYILVKQRMSVKEAQELAKKEGLSEEKVSLIKGDDDTVDEAGESAKEEVDSMVTVITKYYMSEGNVKCSKATKYVDIIENEDMGNKLYPLAHTIWEYKQGSARGESEVKALIPNQIETNKTAMRRLLTAKNISYPQKIYNSDVIDNPEAINTVGGVIEAKGMKVDDVRKAFAVTQPAQMGADVEKLQVELISTTRELANASDTATGQVNPEDASGRAILAVQQASQQPLNEQNSNVNDMIEDIARIWLDMWKTHNEGMQLENITTDPMTGEETVTIENVPASVLEKLKATIKIDITPKSAYDKYAQEISLENLAQNQNFMNSAWLEDFVSLLPADSTMPKLPLEELLKKRKEAQKRIAEIQQQGEIIQQQVGQLMNTGELMPKEMAQFIQPSEQNPQEELQMEQQQIEY